MQESVQREMSRMRAQFNAMEGALARLQAQGAQLSGLIGSLPGWGGSE